MGCSRVRQRAGLRVCCGAVRKERLRSNPLTQDRDAQHRSRQTRHTRERHTLLRNAGSGGRGGSAPQTPRDLSHCANPGETQTETGRREASRIRSWFLARRSGRVSASPCPPLRSLTILSALQPQNHSPCAPAPQPMPPGSGSPRTAESGSEGQIRYIGDMTGVEPTHPRSLDAILGGRFFQTPLKFPVQPHFGPNPAPHGKRPAAPSTMKPKRQRNSSGAP